MQSVTWPERIRPVVVGIDGSRNQPAIVDLGVLEAVRRNAPLLLVHIWPGRYLRGVRSRMRPIGKRPIGSWRRRWPAGSRHTRTWLSSALCCMTSTSHTVERASRRGRLLVAGMGRHNRFAELLYGSLGVALVRQAPCPVLLIPPGWRPAATGGFRQGAAARGLGDA
jgi:nucleotide-binding universal stress UspA family protein